ncbi:MAG: carboxymuconolactone decarboxylase family protein [Phycisphaerales bacterium]|nr:carboxymuconolactone decarboxylase family protein [Phycisphaerales bacterium]
MAHVKLYNGTGDEKARKAQERINKALGIVPETYQAMGRDGAFLEAVLALEHAAGRNLPAKTRELVLIAVSAANGCDYCVHAHRALALKTGATEEEVTAALELSAMMSLYNTFNKAIGLEHDVTPETLGVAEPVGG